MSKIVLCGAPLSTPRRQWSLCAAALFCGIASGMASGVESKFRGETYIRKVPIHFEPQTDGKFISRGLGYSLQLGPDEVALRLENSRAKPGANSSLVRLRFTNANPNPQMEAVDRLPGVSNYYRGNDPSKWRTGVAQFGKVRYREIYPGVDLVFYGRGRELEYDLIVAPGADPNQIRIELEGADDTTLDSSGNIVLRTDAGPLRLRKPLVYQETNGVREEVSARFALHAIEPQSGAARSYPEVSFQLANYDRDRTLIIDPIADFTGGLGGTKGDTPLSVTTLPGGLICAVGSTSSLDFQITPGAAQPTHAAGAGLDAWIAFLSRDGTELIASTYFGGDGDDEALAVATDQFGIAHVTGYTQSANFPVLGSLAQPYGGQGDAFMAAFSVSGANLYSLYYGGSGIDQGNGIAVGADDSIYVSGWTRSTDLPTAAALQAVNLGGVDFFVAKLNPAATQFVYATYLGGNNHEYPVAAASIKNGNFPTGGIDVDSAGNAYVTGSSLSSNFPKVNAYSATANGVFLSKLNPTGSALLYSSGFGAGYGYGIDVDSTAGNGQVLLTGRTEFADFWPLRNAGQPNHGGSGDAIVAQVDTTKSGDASLLYSSFLGGDGEDEARDVQWIKINGVNQAIVTGRTNSTNFPGATEPSGGSILRSLNGGATWTKSNNGLVSADFSAAVQVNCMAVDVLNPQVIYAGTESADVFKTVNGGDLWVRTNTGLTGAAITGLAVHPTNSSIVFAGTAFNGIYVSENGGANWALRNTGLQTNAPFVSFAFGGGAVYAGSGFHGVFKTTNNGGAWTPINTGLTDLRVTTVAIDPVNSDVLVVGTGGRSHPSGVYGSINAGATWSHYNGNLSSVMGPPGPNAFTDLVVLNILLLQGDTARTLFALIQSDPERLGGLATSLDFGQTWTALARFGDLNQVLHPTFGFRDAFSARSLWVDPNNKNNILIGTNGDIGLGVNSNPESKESGRGILRSTDGGLNWSVTGGVGTNVNALALGRTAGNAPAWYAGLSGGYDGFLTTLRLDGSQVSTDIVGGTGDDGLRSLGTRDPAPGLGITTSYLTATGSFSSLDLDRTPGAVQPLPNTIPPGIVVVPVEPANALLLAKPIAAAPALSADLGVTKEMTIGASGGQTGVVCRITVTNNGPDTAKSVRLGEEGSSFETVAIDLPSNPTSIVAPHNENTRRFDLGDMAPGSTREIELFFPVYNDTGEDLGKTRRNVAFAYMESDEVFDPAAGNDEGVDDILIPQTPPGDIPPQTANQSTRVIAGTGDQAPNSGTIITDSQQQQPFRVAGPSGAGNQKKVIFRAIGPSLSSVPGRLADPTMELYNSSGAIIGRNDNWRQTIIGGVITGDQVAEIEASTIPPTNDLESAIVATLSPGQYTTVIRGAGNTTGIGLAEIYDLDTAGQLRLANISTRGFVDTGDNVMIGGLILLGQSSQRIVFRAIGPSLTGFGVAGALQDPALSVVDGNGAVVRSNDNWRSDQEAELIATTIPPSHNAEAAVVVNLTPGNYTAIVSGTGNTTGIALVEVYNLGVTSSAAVSSRR